MPAIRCRCALAALILASLVTACGPSDRDSTANRTKAAPEPQVPPPANETADSAESGEGLRPLPPADAQLRYVGRWAAESRLCADRAWVFGSDSLRTPAGSSCSFIEIESVPGGYDIAATCTAEGPPASDTIRLRFAESARAMIFESEAVADAGLVHCGPL